MRKRLKRQNIKLSFEINPTKFVGFLMLLFGVVIIFKFMFPLVIGLIYTLISLLHLYPLLDVNFKFIGGIFFLILVFKIFEAFLYMVSFLLRKGLFLIKRGGKRK